MKNSLRFYSVFFIIIVAFAIDGCKKQDRKDVTEERVVVPGTKQIVLLVDTENIKPGSPSEIKSYCNFSDLQPGDPIADYTTGVKPGDSVIWYGLSSSAPLEDLVDIKMIIHSGGPPVLGRQDSINGMVKGIIREDAKPGQEETYKIRFKVIKDSGPSHMYILDPKLLVH